MSRESLKELQKFLNLKDKIFVDLLNHVIDQKETLHISNIWSINDLIKYFHDIHVLYSEIDVNAIDSLYENELDDSAIAYIEITGIMNNLRILNDMYMDFTDKLKEKVNNSQFDFEKIHILLKKMDYDNKQGFAENTLSLNKVEHTIGRIERDISPKAEKFESKADFLAALARSDAEKL